MKITFGVVLALLGLLMLAAGRRSRVTLVIGLLTFAYGGYLLFFGIKAWRTQKLVIAFIAAAERGDLATVRRMADSNPLFVNASQSVDDGATVKWPLTVAAKELHEDIVEFLLTRGAIVDAETGDGDTPLHEAGDKRAYGDERISVKRLATLKALLAHGATVDSRDQRQRTPLMANARDGKAVALLIDHHADVKAKDSLGRTALHYAVSSRLDHSDSVTLLLDHGAEVDARDRDGNTPFLLAENAADIETLVARGADPKTRDKNGDTALHLAAKSPMNLYSDLDVLAELCACGLRPDVPDQSGATPLSLARAGVARETDRRWMKGRARVATFLAADGPCRGLAGATKDQRAFAMAGIKCAEDDRGGCAALAWDYDTGKGTPVDKRRAAELYDKACRLGSRGSCTNLAYDYAHGDGVAIDLQHAADLYGKMCDAAEMRACFHLGLMVSKGRGVAKDEARAAALFRRACDGGESDACEYAGR
jgi:ankyrin repeat protein